MRCSRRRGVILYKYFSNGYFVAYTSPPPTAEPLLKEKPFGGRSVQLSLVAALVRHTQLPPPRGTLIADQRRACAARPKGKNEESPGWSLLRTERFEFFPATRAGRQVARATPSLIQLTFTSQRRFFVTFFPEESNVPLVPPYSPYLYSGSQPL